MFAELHLPIGVPVDRDEVEDAVGEAIKGVGEVSGAGTGSYGSNLDLDLDDDVDIPGLLTTIGELVTTLGITGAKIRVEGHENWTPLLGAGAATRSDRRADGDSARSRSGGPVTIPRPLVESIVGTLVLLEYSSTDEVDPDVAIRGLEDIVSCLLELTQDEQREFLAMCVDVAGGYQGTARSGIPQIVAESLGLELP